MYNLFLLASLKYRISASVDDFNLRLKALAELLVTDLPIVILVKLQHPLIDLINSKIISDTKTFVLVFTSPNFFKD